jgi:hypothetical protein
MRLVENELDLDALSNEWADVADPHAVPDETCGNGAGDSVQQPEELTKSAPSDWLVPTPIGEHLLPPIPAGVLPSWLGEHATAVAAATETPIELPAMMDLAAISTCTAGKFAVSPEDGYTEPTNTWTIVAMQSGNRKTAVAKESTEPITLWEVQSGAALKPKIEQIESRRKTLEERIKKLRKMAADPNRTFAVRHI